MGAPATVSVRVVVSVSSAQRIDADLVSGFFLLFLFFFGLAANVNNNPAAFANAYFDIAWLKVYH